MKILAFSLFTLLSVPAFAQQPDVASYAKAVTVLQSQRNQAMDGAATAEVRVMTLAEENATLKAEIEKLKKELADLKAPKSE